MIGGDKSAFSRIWIILFIVIAALVSTAGRAMARDGNVEFMGVDELERGMTGRGRTVFAGTKIEQFDVEIISVLRDVEPGRSIILARVNAPQLRGGGVASGMSGSPVYINGRLIGAIAYTWGFARESICGITPIHEMIEDARGEEEESSISIAHVNIDDSISLPLWGQTLAEIMPDRFARRSFAPGSPEFAGLRRLDTPAMISGASGRLLEKIRPVMSEYGMMPVQAGASGSSNVAPPELRAGSAVGLRLIGGDLNFTAVGTVTHRDEKDIYAFGHPFMNIGRLDAPMTGAYVHDIMPSVQLSFKLADGLETIGAFRFDRGSVVHGRYGERADTIPCRVVITREDNNHTSTYNYSIMRHRQFSPILIGMAASISAERTEPQMRDTMADIKISMKIRDREEPLVIRDIVYDRDISWQLFSWGMTVGFITGNPFSEVEVDAVDFEVRLRSGRRTAEIHAIRVDRHFVKPGETVGVTALIRPYRSSELIEKRAEIEIPGDLPHGTELRVTACDAWVAESLKRGNSPGDYIPENFDHLVKIIDGLERSDNVIFFVSLPRSGVAQMGRSLPDLPGSMMRVIRISIQSGAYPVGDALIKRIPTEWVISGRQSMPLLVIEE